VDTVILHLFHDPKEGGGEVDGGEGKGRG